MTTTTNAAGTEIDGALDRLLASDELSKSATSRKLLAYLVSRTRGGGEGPKEVEIAIDVFARDAGFVGSEDSVVRVSMHALRQKLVQYYAGSGRDEPLVVDIPKGSYRLVITERAPPEAPTGPDAAQPQHPVGEVSAPPVAAVAAVTKGDLVALQAARRRWQGIAAVLALLLAASVVMNLARRGGEAPAGAAVDPEVAAVRGSAFWQPLLAGDRPLLIVLGDLFLYSQLDAATGRTLTVRDPAINSSDDLRTQLANQPQLAAARGLRYSTMVQPSAVLGMASVLRIVSSPGRQVGIRLRDELQAEDLRRSDIVYLGPMTRLGALGGGYHFTSRYRFEVSGSSLTDTVGGETYVPEGSLAGHHKDYALLARYPGPEGNQILIITSGGRNAGLLEVTRLLTSAQGVQRLDSQIASLPGAGHGGFEALLSVTGFKQTGLAADVLQFHSLSSGRQAAAR
jgi:hypothetical protein